MLPAYYNEFDAYCAAWLRNLIAAGHIPAGDVDERDIREVAGDDLKGYGPCHFFAGIGGWAYAGRLAGIPDDQPLWTGSCPCQPLSSAGQRKGHADERHLWPAFYALIAERRPATVFGEQVASKDGREWLAGVRADLEDLGYAVGAADLPAAGARAPQIRQRLWWVGNASVSRERSYNGQPRPGPQSQKPVGGSSLLSRVASADGRDAGTERQQRRGEQRQQPQDDGIGGRLENTGGDGRRAGRNGHHGKNDRGQPDAAGQAGGLGGVVVAGLQTRERQTLCGAGRRAEGRATLQPGGPPDFWSDFDLIPCADGKARRVEPGTFPLDHGVRARVGKLRAYGNAIVPQVAAEFMRCCP